MKKKAKIKMNTTTEIEPLATRVALHPFLAGMNRTQLALLTDCAMATHFKKGEATVIEASGPGDLLGWSWMFPPYVWQFTARAIEPTTALFFYGTILREYCEKDHSLGYELFKRMSAVMMKRLQAARKQMRCLHPQVALVNRRSNRLLSIRQRT